MMFPFTEIDLQQGSDEWLQWRRGGFGASEAGVVMGKNITKIIDRLHREKTADDNHNGYKSAAMLRGIKLEPAARAAYSRKVGVVMQPVCLQHIECPVDSRQHRRYVSRSFAYRGN